MGIDLWIILCSARALGEFGAVNALSKTRGETFTYHGDRCLIYVRNIIIDHSSLCSIIGFSIDRGRCTDLKKYCMVPLTGQTTGKGRKIKCMSK